MIEYVLTTFSNHDSKMVPIKSDGSMHNYRKKLHVSDSDGLADWNNRSISTPIYPFRDQHLPDIIDMFSTKVNTWPDDRKILIFAADQTWAEINLLFQYHKISLGLDKGLDIFLGNDASVLQRWVGSHKSWHDLARWQWREWFSLFYPQWVMEWITAPDHVDHTWLCVSNQQILNNLQGSLEHIARHCGISLVRDIGDFCGQYRTSQGYILAEFDTIASIVDSVISERHFSWSTLSLVGEAILQNRFRQQGYEWFCDGLDQLPCDSVQFRKVIYQSSRDLHA